jgi:hypothetical protein
MLQFDFRVFRGRVEWLIVVDAMRLARGVR